MKSAGQDDGGRHHRAGQGAPAGLVHPGDTKNPAGCQGGLAGKIAPHRGRGQAAFCWDFSLTVVADLPLRWRR